MPVEVSTTIAQLDKTWPLGGDALQTAAAHIRNIKSALQKQFPGTAGNGFATVITATETEMNGLNGLTSNLQDQIDAISANDGIPIGGIVVHVGTLASIPSNYLLCDGTAGTVNLTDRFIIGTNIEGSAGTVGGYSDISVFNHVHNYSHSHTVTVTDSGDHDHTVAGRVVANQASSSVYVETRTAVPSVTAITGTDGYHQHSIFSSSVSTATNTVGVAVTDKNLPPYYTVAFIVRAS